MIRRKASSISIVLVTFSLLVYLMIPLGKSVFERVYYSHLRERALIMVDAAIFSAAAMMDSEDFSERKITVLEEQIRKYLQDRSGIIVPVRIELKQEGELLTVGLLFRVQSIYGHESRTLRIETNYLFETLHSPSY